MLRSYEAFVSAHGYPVIDAAARNVTFETARQINEVGITCWDTVNTDDSGEYGCGIPSAYDVYAGRHGRAWRVAAKGWWHGLADRVVVLTTEAIPVAVARQADPDWTIYELEAPLCRRDQVEVHASRHVTGDNLATLCTDFRTARPDELWFIVSNKVAIFPDTLTHAGARGATT